MYTLNGKTYETASDFEQAVEEIDAQIIGPTDENGGCIVVKKTPLVYVKWDATYTQHRDGISLDPNTQYFQKQHPTTTVGFLIEENDKVIVLASSIYGIRFPNSMAKDFIEIPKSYVIEVNPLDR